jgi:16S rRNA (guanine966-N2)-methyltransferase
VRVTRIISGRAGSLLLDVPDAGTRPTSDRVRESLFGAMEAADLIHGAAVLDLFAGSGALGLEAASRGAASVDLVEKAARAAAVARRNAARVRTALGSGIGATRITVHRSGVDTFLRAAPPRAYDLVLLDPPYDLADEDLASSLELLPPALAPDAMIVVERSGRSPEPAWPGGLSPDRHRRYGDTVLWWARAETPA